MGSWKAASEAGYRARFLELFFITGDAIRLQGNKWNIGKERTFKHMDRRHENRLKYRSWTRPRKKQLELPDESICVRLGGELI
jgi:hypothetical protein